MALLLDTADFGSSAEQTVAPRLALAGVGPGRSATEGLQQHHRKGIDIGGHGWRASPLEELRSLVREGAPPMRLAQRRAQPGV